MERRLNQYNLDYGWLSGARKVESPNFEARPEGQPIDLLVIHNISLPPGEFGSDCIEAFFTNQLDFDAHPFFDEIRGVEVSAHLLIRRDGELVQFVNFNDRAWHAGQSCHRGRENCNDFSIGIELEGTDTAPFTPAQYRELAAVTRALIDAYPELDQEGIAGHSDIAPGRKTDPGACFDWRRYREDLKQL